MSTLLRLLYAKWFPPTDPTTPLTGQTILVTGANTGLGLHAALKIAQLGAKTLVLGVRDPAKGEAARRLILQQGRRGDDAGDGDGEDVEVLVWPLDMRDHGSVRAFAERASALPRLDAAVLNAGVQRRTYGVGAHGWEETLEVNVVSTALLGLLLLPKLKESAGERAADGAGEGRRVPVLEIVGSGLYEGVRLTRDQLSAPNLLELFNGPQGYAAQRQYARSKLLVMYVMLSLAGLTKWTGEGKDVAVLACSPGLCRSDLGREYTSGLVLRIVKGIFEGLFAKSTEEGSRTLVSGITLGPEAHRGYWYHDELKELAPTLAGEEGEATRQRVWHEILDTLRRDVPEVLELSQA